VGVVGRSYSNYGEKRNVYRILVGKPQGKPRRRRKDNVKIDIRDMGWGGMDWIDLVQNRDQKGTSECGNEPSGYIKCWKFWSSCATGGCSRMAQLHGVSCTPCIAVWRPEVKIVNSGDPMETRHDYLFTSSDYF
jgi:hypothetical protein